SVVTPPVATATPAAPQKAAAAKKKAAPAKAMPASKAAARPAAAGNIRSNWVAPVAVVFRARTMRQGFGGVKARFACNPCRAPLRQNNQARICHVDRNEPHSR
ncbi:hypothetical protein EN822_27190, partial [bacterium M00.F.Ca.ET.179.01.1.1]